VQALPSNPDRLQRQLGRPQLIFFSELDGAGLRSLLTQANVLNELVAGNHGVAIALHKLDTVTADVVRMLNAHAVPVVAWLLLPPSEGVWLNLQNYPQALERYYSFRQWAAEQGARFVAVGLDIEPPPPSAYHQGAWSLRVFARRIWLARENVLYTAARAAYTDLIAAIHHDGYEVHTYQLPILADDRRAGTTLVQRAFDLVDLPADVEVLMCYSSIPFRRLGSDLGGALISSYGPTADAIGVGSVGGPVRDAGAETLPPLAWDGLERDLLLAAHHTDTVYVSSLEGCVERGLLARIRAIDWDRDMQPQPSRRMLIGALRTVLFFSLITARFSRALIAWMGWALAILLLLRQLQQWYRRRTPAGYR
jgi:hypothetical protein